MKDIFQKRDALYTVNTHEKRNFGILDARYTPEYTVYSF